VQKLNNAARAVDGENLAGARGLPKPPCLTGRQAELRTVRSWLTGTALAAGLLLAASPAIAAQADVNA